MAESITSAWILGYFVLKSFLINKLREVLLNRLGQKITNFELLSALKSWLSQAVLSTKSFVSYFKRRKLFLKQSRDGQALRHPDARAKIYFERILDLLFEIINKSLENCWYNEFAATLGRLCCSDCPGRDLLCK